MTSADNSDDTAAPPRSRALYVWAMLSIAWCVFLLLAGANVKTQRGSLTIPDWPLMFGELLPDWELTKKIMQPDPLRAEFIHRLIGMVMGMLTIAIAVVAAMREKRLWMRRLCIWVAVPLVIVQGIFGGLGVLTMLGAPWPLLHSTTAQAFLCLLVVIATATSRGWNALPQRPLDDSALSLMRLGVLSLAALFVQLVLGAAARHGYMAREVHAMFALVVAILLVKLVLTGVGDAPSDARELRRPAAAIGILLASQIALGMASWFIASERNEEKPLPLGEIATLNAHLVVGALILALTLHLLMRTFRTYGLPTDERVAREVHGIEPAAVDEAGEPIGGTA